MAIRPFLREQAWLLPPDLGELLPPGHPARFAAAFIDTLTPTEVEAVCAGVDVDGVGAPAYHPLALLGVWVYGFMIGVRSSRRLEQACRDQIPFLWLTGRQCPDHNTLWRFYKKHRQRMRRLLKHSVRTAAVMGLVDLAVQAVDGTKVAGDVNRFRSMDARTLQDLLSRTERAIRELEARNEGGDDPSPPLLPPELAQAEALVERLRAALEQLQAEDAPERVNLTDPDVRWLKGRHGMVAGYNAQAVVSPLVPEGQGALITAADVVTDANDTQQLAPMTEQAEETAGERAAITLADAGYHSGEALAECVDEEHRVVAPEPQDAALANPYHKDRFVYDPATDTFTCPEGQQLTFRGTKRERGLLVRRYRGSPHVCRACPAFNLCTKNKRHGRFLQIGPFDQHLRAHRTWMATDEAQAWKRKRGGLIEPVFGIIKEQQGLRRFLLRGLDNVRSEWALLATAYNLRTLWKAWTVLRSRLAPNPGWPHGAGIPPRPPAIAPRTPFWPAIWRRHPIDNSIAPVPTHLAAA